jgi:hypothetical protein
MDSGTKISSDRTFFIKRVFPLIWFGFLVIFTTVVLTGAITGKSEFNIMMLIVPIMMAAIGFFVFKHLCFDLADEVYDCGEYLLVKKGNYEDKINISDIINISYNHLQNPPKASLRLRNESKLGQEISFSPTVKLMSFKKNPIIEDLILRVDRARRPS